MRCLVLRLAGPMQSWGTQSRFTERDTGKEPSKSGVIGLLCAALGRDRTEPLDDLASLQMGVRVDREGVFSRDYQTAGGGSIDGSRYGVIKASGAAGDPVVSSRYFLADAEFLVALAGSDDLVEHLCEKLRDPVWPLFLGRKAFTPTPPLFLCVSEQEPEGVLRSLPWRRRHAKEEPPSRLRLVLECAPDEGAARMDVPLSFELKERRFATRYVRVGYCPAPRVVDTMEEVIPCISQD